MPTIDQNYHAWNEYSWSKDGDEWNDQAGFGGEHYDSWKHALVETFIRPYITNGSHVLEIGPGHGRWTSLYIEMVRRVTLVDLSPSCIEHCKKRFNSFDHVDYFINDGKRVSCIADDTMDFIWSYDVFVHVEHEEMKQYFAEFARILKKGGVAVIHHPNASHSLFLAKVFLVNKTGPLRASISERIFKRYNNMGRSFISQRMIKNLAKRNALQTITQTDTWGPNNEYDCKKFNDQISVFRK